MSFRVSLRHQPSSWPWGCAFGAAPVCVPMRMFASSRRLREAGAAPMVSAVQIALAVGAAFGAVPVNTSAIGSAFPAGGVLCLAGAIIRRMFAALPLSGSSTWPAPGDAQ